MGSEMCIRDSRFHNQKPARLKMAIEGGKKQIVENSALLSECRKVRVWIAAQVIEIPNTSCQLFA